MGTLCGGTRLAILAVLASPAGGQTGGFPTISSRYFAGGGAKVTVSGSVRIDQEVAINSECSGTVQVTGPSVSGHYTCAGVVSHDAATGKMGKVNIEVCFTAKS